jgi:hypothetical protein
MTEREAARLREAVRLQHTVTVIFLGHAISSGRGAPQIRLSSSGDLSKRG